ncbi:hypothetical protein ADS73_04645 [Lactiplantibacillus plantarum]|nr:hypothetical protein ADS73_04645 [Lactiplantibacillus plantarum]
MIKFRAWYMPFGKYGAMQEMIYSRASHILALAETEPEKYIPEQFTGLTDVNGKEIYEGDIIITHPKYDDERSKCGVVQYGCSRRPEFSYKSKNGEYMSIWSSNNYRTYEVIGNVHEKPELLEEKK